MTRESERKGSRLLRFSLALAIAVCVGLWCGRRVILAAAGSWLVAEDAVAHVDLLVVSVTSPLSSATEVAHLYRDGVASRVVIPRSFPDDVDEETRRLDLAYVDPQTRVRGILAQGGVPREAVVALANKTDGTDSEAASVAAFARTQGVLSLLMVTARSHSARMRWLLRRALPARVDVRVRSPRHDRFIPTAWWQTREQSREVVMEYLRWVNVLVLRDPWARHVSKES